MCHPLELLGGLLVALTSAVVVEPDAGRLRVLLLTLLLVLLVALLLALMLVLLVVLLVAGLVALLLLVVLLVALPLVVPLLVEALLLVVVLIGLVYWWRWRHRLLLLATCRTWRAPVHAECALEANLVAELHA